MTPAAADLPARRPVWQALSDLYLDTAAESSLLQAAARTLAASPYSLDELQRILRDEVHPACAANLVAVAGVWTAFDAAWLEARILDRQRRWLALPWRVLPLPAAIRAQSEALWRAVAAIRAGA